jgi:hypothetical protein
MYKNENDTLTEIVIEQTIDLGRYDIIMSRLHETYPAVEEEVFKNLE